MFTGLIEACGTLRELLPMGEQARLRIDLPFSRDLEIGDSVAVNGCCLTVTETDDLGASFDVLRQTLHVTSLGDLAEGSPVNLERAMQVGDRFGGHFVQGHVDGTGEVRDYRQDGHDHCLEILLPDEISRLCIKKGSLAVDGVSLTIADLEDRLARFWIIPHTHTHTNLHSQVAGARVNLEADMLAKHVAKLISPR
ncbi:MAG: riboflavin synthase [Verrucomicrobiales bacterium]